MRVCVCVGGGVCVSRMCAVFVLSLRFMSEHSRKNTYKQKQQQRKWHFFRHVAGFYCPTAAGRKTGCGRRAMLIVIVVAAAVVVVVALVSMLKILLFVMRVALCLRL